MKGRFVELLKRIEKGEHLSGDYRRNAHDEGRSVVYGDLTVVTDGGETYTTRSGKELERFFADVSFWGCGVNSGVAENNAYYESVGRWCA
jgi:hypothetical protein